MDSRGWSAMVKSTSAAAAQPRTKRALATVARRSRAAPTRSGGGAATNITVLPPAPLMVTGNKPTVRSGSEGERLRESSIDHLRALTPAGSIGRRLPGEAARPCSFLEFCSEIEEMGGLRLQLTAQINYVGYGQ